MIDTELSEGTEAYTMCVCVYACVCVHVCVSVCMCVQAYLECPRLILLPSLVIIHNTYGLEQLPLVGL